MVFVCLFFKKKKRSRNLTFWSLLYYDFWFYSVSLSVSVSDKWNLRSPLAVCVPLWGVTIPSGSFQTCFCLWSSSSALQPKKGAGSPWHSGVDAESNRSRQAEPNDKGRNTSHRAKKLLGRLLHLWKLLYFVQRCSTSFELRVNEVPKNAFWFINHSTSSYIFA